MDDRQLAWNRYAMHIDLYQKYMDIVLKINLFYYGITGALLSFYFSADGNGKTIEYALLLPILFSLGLIGLFWFSVTTLAISNTDIASLVKELEMPYFIRIDALIYLMRGSIGFVVLTTIGLLYIFYSSSL